ncbi:unnamed protein product [Euphydryas editha]|uniref:PiggyBac transposable element-derived protein domain-containing protein n=1 Tax=Euphydryas editha TaxID=104508 RepID=A0AAU9TFD8_EUPED|nr:unnamed protein product [Euphydryas editha]
MSKLTDSDILRALLDETNEFESQNENFEEESENDSDHLSIQSDINSEFEAELPCLESDSDDDIPLSELRQNRASYYTGKDGVTKWQKEQYRSNVRSRAENIITNLPGPKSVARNKMSPLQCFELFITDEMIDEIVNCTNEKISMQTISDHKKLETTKEEMKALFGLLFISGLVRSGRQSTIDLWSTDGTGMDIFRDTMSRNRFGFLLNNLRFDSTATRSERIQTDRLAPIRNIFVLFIKKCQDAYIPHENLTIDEELVAFRGRCSFRQYIPSKPAKYGIKIYSLVDSKTFYTLNMEIYCGKQHENSPFAVSNKPYDLVDRLVQCVSQSSRNVTMDNFFTSYETTENLLKNHKLTVVGTLRANKTCIPPVFKKNREVNSSMFGFQKDITIVSYVPRPRKMVYLMSSLHHDKEIDSATGSKQKPAVITFYNHTKSGVDMVDKLSRTYDVSRNSKRWPLTIFFALLNHAGINGMIIHMFNNGIEKNKTNLRGKFIRELGISLVKEHLNTRRQNQKLPKDLRTRISKYFGNISENLSEPPAKKPNTMQRCSKCPRKKDRKTKYSCKKCYTPICMEHADFFCQECGNFDTNDLN